MYFLRDKNLLILFSFILFLCSLNLNASVVDTNAVWEKANQHYEQGDYEQAKKLYTELLEQGVSSASLDYNLGNTYYRLNENAKSILFYERALWKDPGNHKIEDNLSLAKSRIDHPLSELNAIFFIVWWQNLVKFFGIPALAIISLILFISILTLLFFELTGKITVPYFGRWLSGISVLFILFLTLYFSGHFLQKNNQAVVLKEKTPLYLDLQSEKVEIYIPAGTLIQIEEEKESMLFVSLPNGAEGWIHQDSAEKVVKQEGTHEH